MVMSILGYKNSSLQRQQEVIYGLDIGAAGPGNCRYGMANIARDTDLQLCYLFPVQPLDILQFISTQFIATRNILSTRDVSQFP